MAMKYLKRNQKTAVVHEIPTNSNLSSLSSEVQVKTSLFNRVHQSWLAITLGLIAIAGVLGTVGVTVVALVVLRHTTIASTTITTASSTTSITTTTARICLTIPSPRPSNVWYVVDTLSTPRILHTSTYISQDNSVLISGGLYGATVLISTDKYIPSTGCFQTGITMPRARRSHTADILPAFPNYILFCGGYGTATILNVADLFNPITGTTLTLSLTTVRYAHASAIFGSSQLILVGGIDSTSQLKTADAMFSGSTSTFFSTTNTMNVSRSDHTATRLGNNSGIVLVAGGRDTNTYYPYTELYYGASNIFFPLGTGGTMPTARAYHTATYLPTFNKVLITGGHYSPWDNLNTMILFDAGTLSFTTLTSTMSSKRSWHTATLLPNGKVLVVGGSNNVIIVPTCDLIDPANNYLTVPAANLSFARYQHTATLIPDNNGGMVLICGGSNGTTILNTCELYII